MDEVASAWLDLKAAGVADEALGGLGADRPGAFQHGRRVGAEVHDEGGGTAPHAAIRIAGLASEHDERIGGGLLPLEDGAGLLVVGALGLGDVPDGLLERGALLEWQASVEDELAAATGPGHAERAALVQRGVVLDDGRGERACGERDRAGRFADGDAGELSVTGRGGELGGSRDLVERELAAAHGLIERRQITQRLTGLGDARGGAVVAAGELRQPLRARGAARGLPVAPVIGSAHDLRKPLRQARDLGGDLTHLTTTSLALALQRLVDRPVK